MKVDMDTTYLQNIRMIAQKCPITLEIKYVNYLQTVSESIRLALNKITSLRIKNKKSLT